MKLKYKNLLVVIAYIFLCCLGLACSAFCFSSVAEDRDYIVLNELSSNKDESDKRVLFSFPEYNFENIEQWNEYSHTFDSRFAANSYSNIFRLIDDSKLIIDGNYVDLNVSDITHYGDKYYNFGNVQLLESDGQDFSKIDEEGSIYIDKFYADYLKSDLGLYADDYKCLFDRKIEILINGVVRDFSIKGVYDENIAVKNRCFNKLYRECFGHTFFISREHMNELSCGTGYFFTGFDLKKNMAIFDFVKSRFSKFISSPENKINNSFLIRGVSLPLFNQKSNSKPFSPVSFWIFLVGFIIVFALVLALSPVICKKMLSIFRKYHNNYSLCIIAFVTSIIISSLLLYYLLSNIQTKIFGIFLLKNVASNFAYFILSTLIIIGFCLQTNKLYYFEKVSNYFLSNPSFINGKSIFDVTDLYTEVNKGKERKIAVVFSRGIDLNSAGGQRTISDCLLLISNGFKVHLFGFESSNFNGELIDNKNLIIHKWPLYKGKNLFKKYMSFMSKKHIINSFAQVEGRVNLTLVYSVLSISQINAIKRYCKMNCCDLIFDSVEFQNLLEQNMFSFFSYYLPNIYINRFAIKKDCYVLAISKYLENYYKKKNVLTYRLPFINRFTNMNSVSNRHMIEAKRCFAYTGIPGKKDDLYGLIKAFSNLTEEELKETVLIIVGPKINDLYKQGIPINLIEKVKNSIMFVGRQPYSAMKDIYSVCDFTVLLKKSNMRHAKADFPSKVSQSLSFGIPVIANASSDLNDFLVDGYNGLIFDGADYLSLSESFKRALTLREEDIVRMKENSILTCKEKLSFGVGVNVLKELISEIEDNERK